MSLAYLLLWPAHLRSTYEYGCQVSVSPEHVVSYRAPLMPPGEVIHDWRSQRNAGQEHLSCELPILTPGRAYTLDGNITVIAGGVYLRLRFFDATNAELDPIILDGTSGRFTFPSTAVNYRIELVNTHHQQVNQKRDAFLAAQPHTSPQASGLDAWQALERHWQPQSVQNQEDQL